MFVEWREAMSVGNETVDNDHKYLIDVINQFEATISGIDVDHRKSRNILLNFIDYAGQHFAREEQLQVLVQYPFSVSHCRAHREALRKLVAVLSSYTQAESRSEQNRMVYEIAAFLKEWLIDHIIRSDLRMKPYIADCKMNSKAIEKYEFDIN